MQRWERRANLILRHGDWLFLSAMATASVLLCARFVHMERAFYYWDLSFYEEETYRTALAFSHSLGEGWRYIQAGMNEDYNRLFTLPLLPFIWTFGARRITFICALCVMYFVPFLIMSRVLARRIFPEHAFEAGCLATVFAIGTVNPWLFMLRGYPDIGGAVIVIAMILMYERSSGERSWSALISVGVLGGGAILFRRHYVYAVAALYAAFALHPAVSAAIGTRRITLREMRYAFLNVLVTGACTSATVYGLAPEFVRHSLSSSFRQSLAGWQDSGWSTLVSFVLCFGVPVILLGMFGFIVLPRITTAGRNLATMLVTTGAVWSGVWLYSVRQAAFHYPHVLPILITIGLVSLWLWIGTMSSRTLVFCCRAVMLIAIGLNVLVAAPLIEPAVNLGVRLPHYTTAARMMPLTNPAYDQIVDMVRYLHSQSLPGDHVVVGASSPILNSSLLENAQDTVYGPADRRVHFDSIAQVDSSKVLPVPELMNARFVIIAKPFQHHRPPELQKVVHVLLEAFDQSWRVSADFTLLPARFTLGEPGSEVLIYERKRPSSPEVVQDTIERMMEYTGLEQAH